MSAPDTNIEKQTRRHRPALIGIGLVVVAILAFILLAPTTPEKITTPDAILTAD